MTSYRRTTTMSDMKKLSAVARDRVGKGAAASHSPPGLCTRRRLRHRPAPQWPLRSQFKEAQKLIYDGGFMTTMFEDRHHRATRRRRESARLTSSTRSKEHADHTSISSAPPKGQTSHGRGPGALSYTRKPASANQRGGTLKRRAPTRSSLRSRRCQFRFDRSRHQGSGDG